MVFRMYWYDVNVRSDISETQPAFLQVVLVHRQLSRSHRVRVRMLRPIASQCLKLGKLNETSALFLQRCSRMNRRLVSCNL
jgi:hypothetical protein